MSSLLKSTGRDWLATSVATRYGRLKKIIKRRRKIGKADVVVVSHAKSGRTWLVAMISHVYHRRYGIAESELLSFDNFHRIDGRIPRILFSHDNRKDEERGTLFSPSDFNRRKVVLLVRDPRDVAASSFFQSLRNARKGASADNPGNSLYDYVVTYKLPRVIGFLQHWQKQLDQIEECLIVRYEDLRAHTEEELARILTFIEGCADHEEISEAVAFASFDSLKKKEASNFFASDRLRPGDPSDPNSFKVRRGKVAGYKDYFSDEQREHIDTMIEEANLHAFGYPAHRDPRSPRALATGTTAKGMSTSAAHAR